MGLFKKIRAINNQEKEQKIGEFSIKQIKMSSNRDFTVLRQSLQRGNIMICNLNPIFQPNEMNMGNRKSYQHQLQQIKNYCKINGGSVSKLKDHILIITPNSDFQIKRY